MGDPTIRDAIPDATSMIILGNGALTANALISAGQRDASMIVVEPQNGKPGPAQTVAELTRVPDPNLKLEIAPNTPQMTIGTSGPGMGGPGR
jgi:hypothetical protein